MMKNGIAAFFLALFWNAVAVSANCQTVTLTFNFKPKFPYGNSLDYACGDMDHQTIEEIITKKLKELFVQFELNDVEMANMKRDGCLPYRCTEPAGHKCLPYCMTLTICGLTDLSSWTTLQITDEQLAKIQEEAIDSVRASIPECMGIQNQLMIDVHASFF
jgi:hypothetical protein